MKKILKNALFIMIVVFSCNKMVYASEVFYVNNKGIKMTEEQYYQLEKFYSPVEISNMEKEKFDYEMKYQFYESDVNNLFIREDVYYGEEGEVEIINQYVITENEYNTESTYGIPEQGTYCTNSPYPDSYCWNTMYKQLQIKVNYTDLENDFIRVTLTNIWKSIPSEKNFDVIGIMWPSNTFDPANYQAYQTYKDANGSGSVSYSFPGTNTKQVTSGSYHGFATGQNIVNSITSDLRNQIILDGTIIGSGVQFFGSYQHATISSSLSDTHNFTFSRSGYGGVFAFGNYTKQKYDGMGGVYTNVLR